MVECNLAKVEVAGSNPVSRSMDPRGMAPWFGQVISGTAEQWVAAIVIDCFFAPLATFLFLGQGAAYPSG